MLETEPIQADSPLLALRNVVITPHAAFYSRESLVEMKRRVSEAMVAALVGPVVEPREANPATGSSKEGPNADD